MTSRSLGPCRALAVLAAVLIAVGAGCDRGVDSSSETAGQGQTRRAEPLRVIQHEEPRRDFVGPRPVRFRWSPIAGADRFAIGLWSEADQLLWRHDELAGPQVDWPAGLHVEPGTFYWSVSALQNGREIAKSGLAAFVVEE